MQKPILKNKKFIFLLFLSSIFLFWQLHENKNVEIRIPSSKDGNFVLKMPLKDKKRIEYLFKSIFIINDGAYTLFGTKPVWMGSYTRPFETNGWYFFLDSLTPPNIRKYLCWKTWEKYQHILDNSSFLFFAEEHPVSQKTNSKIILLINKPKLKKVISENLEDFQNVLQMVDIDDEYLLNEAKTKPLIKKVLRSHDGLVGTVLGYGRNNAWLFEERNNGKEIKLSGIWEASEVHEFMLNLPLTTWFYLGTYPEDISKILGYPSFAVIPNSEETQKLRKEILETRSKILEYYQGKDFLEATLTLLLQDTQNSNHSE